MAKSKSKAAFMISAVAEQYEIHPQTLRLYEREGLLKPSRSEGNTRLYTEGDIERLEVILHLTRDLGVNLAGVEIILNMREKMDRDAIADRRVRGDAESGIGGAHGADGAERSAQRPGARDYTARTRAKAPKLEWRRPNPGAAARPQATLRLSWRT